MTDTKERKPRKAAARNTHIVIGAMEENARLLQTPPTEDFAVSRGSRILELIDELRRSLGKNESEEA